MTELFCGNGHTVTAGETECLRCGTAIVDPNATVAAEAETESTEAGETEQTTDGDQSESTGEATDSTEAGETASTEPTGEATAQGEQPGDLAGQMAADQAQS